MSCKLPANIAAVPPRGFFEQVRRHQRRNVAVFLAEGLTSSFCWGFIESPVFAAYLLALGCSPLTIQAAGAAYLFAWYVPMFLFVPRIERRATRVRQLVGFCVPNRLVLAMLAASAWAAGAWGPGAGMTGVWAAIGLLVLTGGGVHVCWQDLNSRIVLPSSRGLYVGARLVIVTVGVVSTGLVTYGFLGQAALTGDRGVPPLAFAWPFTVGTVVFLLALPLLLLLREPIPDGKPPAWAGYGPGLRRLLSILRLDRRFARFLSVRALTCTIWLFSVSLMSAMAHEQFGISKADIAMWFTAAFYIAQAAGAPLGGALGDRIGHKLVHCISLGLFSAAYVLAFSLYAWPAGARFGGFLAILALQGVAGGWYFLSQFNLVFEFADDHRRSSYIALTGLVIGWALLGCGVLGGALVAWLGYASTLLVALGAVLVAAVLALLYMPDPRREVHPPTMLPVDRS